MNLRAEAVPEAVAVRAATTSDESIIRSLRTSVGWSATETGLGSLAAGRSLMYILEVSGVPAAAGALVLRGEDPELADGSRSALISNLIVGPTFQRRGLGTRMLRFLEDEARTRGLQRVTIGVDVPNVRARQLYEREGYAPLKDKVEAWGAVNYLAKDIP